MATAPANGPENPPDAQSPEKSPPNRDRRIVGYDLARALAVFGMVLVNFKVVMTMGGPQRTDPTAIFASLFEGRAAATFVVLAGIGISLMTKRALREPGGERARADRMTVLRRALFLFVVGLAFAPIWPADILHFYGVYLFVAAWLIASPTKMLAGAAALLVTAFPVLLMLFDYGAEWDWSTLTYHGFWTPQGMFRHLFYNGFHPVVPWLAFLLVGMIIGRRDLRVPKIRRPIFFIGLTTALAAEAISFLTIRALNGGADAEEQELIRAFFGTEIIPPTPLYMLAAGGAACAVIAVCVALGEKFHDAAWLRPWIATGQLALTLYVAHIVVGMGALDALGMLQNQTLETAIVATIVFSSASIVFAHLWRKKFKRGPLEAVMRKLC